MALFVGSGALYLTCVVTPRHQLIWTNKVESSMLDLPDFLRSEVGYRPGRSSEIGVPGDDGLVG